MAELAMVFHWSPDVMEQMEIEDLAQWRTKARDLSRAQMEAMTPHDGR